MFVRAQTQAGAAAGLAQPLLRGAPLGRPRAAADVLVCREHDNRVRWQPGQRLHHLFEQRCDALVREGRGAHLAVDGAQRRWTYGELDRRANQLARHLLSRGLRTGERIGLLFDKSVHSYLAMLAVLKIHAAYVPLDPGFPAGRIAFIAEDARLRTILSTSSYRELAASAGAPVLCVDEAGAHLDGLADGRLDEAETGPPADELCYVIYTSGSTGRPKGVPIEHGPVCNFVAVAAEQYGYRASDRVYQGLTLAFDFAVEEIWVPLAAGATLLPNESGASLLGGELAGFLKTRRATAMCCVPTLLATLDEDLPELRLLIVSGEACPRDLVARWHSPGRTLLNAYGPTETTVTATLSRPRPGEPVTIGTPLPTYSVVILEPGAERALPFGEEGEIGIAGIGVAQGYLNREEQTRRAFIRDFLGIPNNPSGRIYRTGDLGRVNERGELEYLGRIDTQVKIRGYRIELAEIESVLLRLPQVAQAVVSSFEPIPGVSELVAYYTLKPGAQQLAAEDIARGLRRALPGYMVPAYYERLDAIPMLPSDKADRKALPAPGGARMDASARPFVAPRDERERAVAGVLASLLKLEKVSMEDDFFDELGANSLLMAQFGARLKRELGIAELSMRDLYLHPTVRRLAAFLEHAGGTRTPLREERPVHVASDGQYALCGLLQLGVAIGLVYLQAFVWWEGYEWIIAAVGLPAAYGRAALFSAGVFALAVLTPVAVKWLLIGRWTPREFPVWSLEYLRFWTVRQLTRANPMVLFAGTPLYVAYLRLLGARVSWKSVILTPRVPACPDLLSIGEGAVVSKAVSMAGYKAEGGRIRTGPVTIERDAFVGEATVLDIDTVMEAGSELGHASSLHAGQRLAAGRSYHGSPAEPARIRFRRLAGGTASLPRMIAFPLAQLALLLLVALPLPFVVAHCFLGADHYSPSTELAHLLSDASLAHLPEVLGWTSLAFLASVLAGLAVMVLVPRVLNRLIEPGRIYPLYGFHYWVHRNIEGLSNSRFYNELFGDSSFVVHYLAAIGYRFRGMEQTGSNFGQSQVHHNPFLCEFGKGTMVSDGLALLNAEHSPSSFRLSRVAVGARSFLGNAIAYPPNGMAGDNCLLGTKVMVPVDGPRRENIGLLGSPSFEIPRSVRRDALQAITNDKDELRRRLRQKNASNAATLLLFLLAHCVAANLAVSAWFLTYGRFAKHGPLYIAVLVLALWAILTPYHMLVDWASLGFRRLQPRQCSIYDEHFWKHERHWKLGLANDHLFLGLLSGTPFKGLAWRALGVRVGKKLFDDGCAIPEKTLVTIGDHCTIGAQTTVQAHSLEDGMFKSDRIVIGNRCTIGASCYVHYGVRMDDEAILALDAFLMKGEHPQARSVWRGNPASEMAVSPADRHLGKAS